MILLPDYLFHGQQKRDSGHEDRQLNSLITSKEPSHQSKDESRDHHGTDHNDISRTYHSDDPMLRLLEEVAESRPLLLPWDSEDRIQKVNDVSSGVCSLR